MVLLFGSTATFAQKFAFVDTEYILNMMPEYKSAQKQIDLLALEWQKEIETRKAEISKMKSDYEAEKVFLTEELKPKREKDIAAKEKSLSDFQMEKFGPDGELFKKRQELIKPIQDKIFDAIQKVARQNALDFVFDRSSSVTMLFTNPKYDLSDDVLEEMGIVPGGEQEKKDGGKQDPNEPPQEIPK